MLERHQQIGYSLLGLLLFRVAWWLWGGRYTRARNYRTSWRALRAHFQGVGEARPQTAPGALIAVVFVMLVAIQVITGLFATDDIFTEGPLTRHVSGDTASAMTWVHHRVFWLIIAAIAVHLLAHVVYGLRGDATPAAMITGRKPLPLEPAQPALARAAAPRWCVPSRFGGSWSLCSGYCAR